MSTLAEELARRGTVSRTFGERLDSRATIVGLATSDGDRIVVKHAVDAEAVGWLQSALRFHAAVRHSVIVPVVDSFETDDGLGIVMPWARGESLVDAYDAAVPAPDDPGSPYERFLQQPPERLAAVVGQIIDAHVAVASAGFVAVDLYSGCLLYDFETGSVSLIDLDMYRPGPYVLEGDRQYGSASLMPPEEFERGATIDERATVFTLGRMALVYLGCARKAAPERRAFRGTELQWDTAMKATRAAPADRYSTVAALATAWSHACSPL